MKNFLFRNKLLIISLLLVIVFLIACYDFELIDQPYYADLNSVFDVPITVSLEAGEDGGTPHFGILLPIGWTVTDSIQYTGIFNGTWIYSTTLTDTIESRQPAPSGYYWWVGIGGCVDSLLEGTVSFTPQIETGSQPGLFYISYLLGDDSDISGPRGNPLLRRQSNNHPISVGLPPTMTVTNTNNDGVGSLRHAIKEVRYGGEVLFSLPSPATIALDSQLVIDRNIRITGPVSDQLTVSGNNQTRVIWINENLDVNISNLIIANGKTSGEIGSGGGIYCNKSELNLGNVTITGNSTTYNKIHSKPDDDQPSSDGGGIYCTESNISLNNVTITKNLAYGGGGGIFFDRNSNLLFDNNNRCNIYLNIANEGDDLYNGSDTLIFVPLDTFTVLNPQEYHVFPIELFNFNIINGATAQVNADLYVSTEGDNSNSGLTPADPLQTIHFAFSKILADSLIQRSIYVTNGEYNPSTTEKLFPIRMFSNISLIGESRDSVVLNSEGKGSVIKFSADRNERYKNITIENVTITGGSANDGGGIYGKYCDNLIIRNVTIKNNSAGYIFGGGILCSGSNIQITNVIIDSNTVFNSDRDGKNGGGMACWGTNIQISNTIISNNSVIDEFGSGGGLFCYSPETTVFLSDVSITNNHAGRARWAGGVGGGIKTSRVDTLHLSNVSISDNYASWLGGGVAVDGSSTDTSIINLSTVNIFNNYAASAGGGICRAGESRLMFDSTNRCNIYLNESGSNGSKDLYSCSSSNVISVIVDTFTVLNPTITHATPIHMFTFDILHDASGLASNISEEIKNLPTKFALEENYPNPFNPKTTISYQLPAVSKVEISIYNLLGQKVSTLINRKQVAGNYKVEWNAIGFASGLYFCRIETNNGYVKSRKLILMK